MTAGRVSQARVRSVNEGADARISQARVRTIYEHPAEGARVAQAVVRSFDEPTPMLWASQLFVRVLIKGRVDEPRIRAWTFTLDGHDYYVLRLGSAETLVYDTYSEQWSVYGTGTSNPWRAHTGRNWQGGRKHALNWSDVIVGDDTLGVLSFLSPDDDLDDDPATGELREFSRRVTGQVVVKPGYASAPCYGVQLFGSIGSGEGTVSLDVSDDLGTTYTEMGDVTLVGADYNTRAHWRSLGQMVAPGRLFRITDTGSLKRIDGLVME